jgi:hypothetical protein
VDPLVIASLVLDQPIVLAAVSEHRKGSAMGPASTPARGPRQVQVALGRLLGRLARPAGTPPAAQCRNRPTAQDPSHRRSPPPAGPSPPASPGAPTGHAACFAPGPRWSPRRDACGRGAPSTWSSALRTPRPAVVVGRRAHCSRPTARVGEQLPGPAQGCRPHAPCPSAAPPSAERRPHPAAPVRRTRPGASPKPRYPTRTAPAVPSHLAHRPPAVSGGLKPSMAAGESAPRTGPGL